MVEAPTPLISVIGASAPSPEQEAMARRAGELLAQSGLGVVTGGRGGVMSAACRGARAAGGLTVGILPGLDPAEANPWCQVVLPTGLGQARNVLVVAAGLAVLAVGGGPGTLSEIGHALKMGKLVVGLDTWRLPGIRHADHPEQAVDWLTTLVREQPPES